MSSQEATNSYEDLDLSAHRAPTYIAKLNIMDDKITANWPSKTIKLQGHFVRLVHLAAHHADDLWPTISSPEVMIAKWWDYLGVDPVIEYSVLYNLVKGRAEREGGVFYAIMDSTTAKAIGWIGLVNINVKARETEVGIFLPASQMQRTPRATEGLFLLLTYAFGELGFEQVYWSCHRENEASCRAVERLGFQNVEAKVSDDGQVAEEAGVRFMVKAERWETVRSAIERWLEPINFDDDGIQLQRLKVPP